MKVLQLLKTSHGATWALLQIRELVLQGIEVHVVLPAGGPLISNLQDVGAHVHLLDLDIVPGKIPSFIRSLRKLRQIVETIKPDLIHSHFFATTLMMRMALRNIKTRRIFQVPGPLHLEHLILRSLDIYSGNKFDFWIGSCEWTKKRYLHSGAPLSRVFLNYYGTDLQKFDRSETFPLRASLGVSNDTKLVGMVAYFYRPKKYLGMFRGIKGHEDFLEAISICLARNYKIQAVIVGGPWRGAETYADKVKKLGLRLCGDRVSFLGYRSDVHAIYPSLDLVVHPSLSENVGGALESLLHGVPTITTDIGGFPDLIRPGETGSFVKPRSPHMLANAICAALDDPERSKKMASTGRALTQTLMDVRHTALELGKIYETILKIPI